MRSAEFRLHAEVEESHWWFVARRRIMRSLVERLVPPARDPDRRATIVDVGCGTGANIASLSEGYRAVGIDASEEAVDYARQRFGAIDFRVGLAPEGVADCLPEARLVMMMDVLEHVEDDFHLLSSVMAQTQPGTLFLLTVPANANLWSDHDEQFGHYRRYEPARFRQIWSSLPARTRLLSYYNVRLYPFVKLVRWWKGRAPRTDGRVNHDLTIPGATTNRLLESLFAAEQRRLLQLLDGEGAAFASGVSLIAVVEREAGRIEVCGRPEDVAADLYDPAVEMLV